MEVQGLSTLLLAGRAAPPSGWLAGSGGGAGGRLAVGRIHAGAAPLCPGELEMKWHRTCGPAEEAAGQGGPGGRHAPRATNRDAERACNYSHIQSAIHFRCARHWYGHTRTGSDVFRTHPTTVNIGQPRANPHALPAVLWNARHRGLPRRTRLSRPPILRHRQPSPSSPQSANR